MKTKNKTITGVCCFLLAAGMVVEAREPASPPIPATQSPYPVMDSGVWADWHGYIQSIYWVDNGRVIFQTVKDNDKTRVSSGPFNLSVWELGKGVKAHTPYANGVHVCVRDGMVRYTLVDEKGIYHPFYGKFGEEKAIPLIKRTYSDELNCPIKSDPEIVAKLAQGRNIYPLLDRHGYLDVGSIKHKPGVNEPAVFYPFGHAKGIELPIRGRDINTVRLRYYPFKGAYLVYDFHSGGDKKGERVWWLYPNGRTEEEITPARPYPTRKGVVTMWGKGRSAKDPGSVGLYLWSGENPVKLIAGFAEDITVSPDGCKLAFAHYPYLDATLIKDPAPITLKVINLCPEAKNHG
jgi:hypothetical protein